MTKLPSYKMKFDIGTIKHLGLQMYSTLPPVIGELVSNAWDADATAVSVEIPEVHLTDESEIVVTDNGNGMSDDEISNAYLVVGRDRRKEEGTDLSPVFGRRIQGRKGIGKFSAFGIAGEIEIETVKNGITRRFKMNYEELKGQAAKREMTLPGLPPSGTVTNGTKITLRQISKFRSRRIPIQEIRRGLARRFAIISEDNQFTVSVNGRPISVEERDLKRLLDKDASGNRYIWTYDDVEIVPGTGWRVSGWIGALDRTTQLEDGVQRGIAVMARKKLVQEPFVFDATVGQQYALSYLIGELHAEFVDESDDTIGTTRNSLVWDVEANAAFKAWGQREVNRIAREWAERRSRDNEAELLQNPLYAKFKQEAEGRDNHRAVRVADKLLREVIKRNPVVTVEEQEPIVQMCMDFVEFDAFWELAEDVTGTSVEDTGRLMTLFREWEIVEAKEMMRVTNGRIATIEKLQHLIDENALEVPTLHAFLKEFPWVLDPRWTLIADEKRYSQLLREKFPESDLPEEERRIDFLCVREGENLVVVEIKRPKVRAGLKELGQIEAYVQFMRDLAETTTTDPELRHKTVVGYLLCGDLIKSGPNAGTVRQKCRTLENDHIYVRCYRDLLGMVEAIHSEFLERYDQLRRAKSSSRELRVDAGQPDASSA